jgi:DNA-binding GntR family transcriptional regulator
MQLARKLTVAEPSTVRTGYNPSPMDEPRTAPNPPPQPAAAPSGPLAGSGSAAARVYAHVKERLLDGSFPGGALLSENELSQQLGLSRTPVRQAFVQLEAEGLLELYPKRGALVVPVAASEIEDVFEARLLVEEHCTRRAATAGGRPLATELAAAIEEQEAAIAMGDGGMAEFAKSDRRFHRAIVAAAGNAILTRLYDALRDRQQRIAATSLARNPADAERFLAEHRRIADALGRAEAADACELVSAHLRSARDSARGARDA